MKFINSNDTICAIATGGSMSAVAVIRVSGLNAIEIVNKIFVKTSQKKNHIQFILEQLEIKIK